MGARPCSRGTARGLGDRPPRIRSRHRRAGDRYGLGRRRGPAAPRSILPEPESRRVLREVEPAFMWPRGPPSSWRASAAGELGAPAPFGREGRTRAGRGSSGKNDREGRLRDWLKAPRLRVSATRAYLVSPLAVGIESAARVAEFLRSAAGHAVWPSGTRGSICLESAASAIVHRRTRCGRAAAAGESSSGGTDRTHDGGQRMKKPPPDESYNGTSVFSIVASNPGRGWLGRGAELGEHVRDCAVRARPRSNQQSHGAPRRRFRALAAVEAAWLGRRSYTEFPVRAQLHHRVRCRSGRRAIGRTADKKPS
jgi:hypothetical protein